MYRRFQVSVCKTVGFGIPWGVAQVFPSVWISKCNPTTALQIYPIECKHTVKSQPLAALVDKPQA